MCYILEQRRTVIHEDLQAGNQKRKACGETTDRNTAVDTDAQTGKVFVPCCCLCHEEMERQEHRGKELECLNKKT